MVEKGINVGQFTVYDTATAEDYLEDIQKETQEEFDNADGLMFVDEDIPHDIIGDYVMEHMNIRLYNGRLYVFENGVYVLGDRKLEKKLVDICKGLRKSKRREVLEYIKLRAMEEDLEINANYINFKNGLLDVRNGQLLPHNPDIFTINQLNCNYIENAPADTYVDKYLDEISCGKEYRRKTILQIMGYSFTSSTVLQKFFIFFGKTAGNSKSVLLEIQKNIIGPSNISHVGINELQERFNPAEIVGKLVNTVSELPECNVKSVDKLKAMVTGDEIKGERKFKDGFNFIPYAKHIFATNSLPKIFDKSDGIYRRMNILLFEAQFTEEQKDNFDIQNLLTPSAKEYLAYISVQAYLELLSSPGKKFANEEESRNAIIDYKKDNHVIGPFLESETIRVIDNIKRPEMYEQYLKWCAINEYESIKKQQFYKEVLATGIFELKILDGIYYFKRIKTINNVSANK